MESINEHKIQKFGPTKRLNLGSDWTETETNSVCLLHMHCVIYVKWKSFDVTQYMYLIMVIMYYNKSICICQHYIHIYIMIFIIIPSLYVSSNRRMIIFY